MGEIKPWWLDLELIGFDDDDEDDSDDEGESEDDEDDEDEESDEDEEESDDEDEEGDEDEEEEPPKKKKENVQGLKSALRKERLEHKKYKRRYLAEKRKNDGKSSDDDKSKDNKDDKETKDTGPSEREKKLAAKLKDQAVDQSVIKWATKLGFADPEDAAALVNRRDIIVDQDEEDPDIIEVDDESVEDVVKDLAKKKKHLLTRNSGGPKSGSKMGGRKKGSKGLSDDKVREKFGLARRT